MKIALGTLPVKLNIQSVWNYQHFLVVQSIHQTLLRVSNAGTVVSDLAKSWKVSQDGLKYTFKLNDCKFSDSTSVTVKNVIDSFKAHLDTQNNSAVKNYLKNYINTSMYDSGFEKVSDNELNIYLKAPYPPFIMILTMPSFAISKGGSEYGIGSGPYKLKDKYNEERIELIKNPHGCTRAINETITLEKVSNFNNINLSNFDVILGAPHREIEKFSNETMKINASHSLAFFHYYFNFKNTTFSNFKVREYLYNLITQFQKKHESLIPFSIPLSTYFPKGVLSPTYYRESESHIPNTQFHKTNVPKIDREIIIVLRSEYFSPEYATKLQEHLAKNGIVSSIVLVTADKAIELKKQGAYDIISLGYMGNFPDPDGLIDPIFSSGSFNYLETNTEQLEDKIRVSRFNSDPTKRIKEYEKIFIDFELKKMFIPGFQLLIPILHNKNLSIPDSTYRYEGEIFNILWKE